MRGRCLSSLRAQAGALAGATWGRGIALGLTPLLVLLGRQERRGGLESLRVPEILHLDRI